jgi:DNA-binding beta-propeller fold protein YncE
VGTAAKFNQPYGVALDAAGNVYVAEWGNHCIRKIIFTDSVTTLAGNGSAGFINGHDSTVIKFNSPAGVAVDAAGNIYVADCWNHCIRKISPADSLTTTLAGSGDAGYIDGTGTAARFSCPTGVAVDAAGNVYVADCRNNYIRKITPDGKVTTIAGTGEQGFADGAGMAAKFNAPTGIAVDAAGNIYVADCWNHCIRKITVR